MVLHPLFSNNSSLASLSISFLLQHKYLSLLGSFRPISFDQLSRCCVGKMLPDAGNVLLLVFKLYTKSFLNGVDVFRSLIIFNQLFYSLHVWFSEIVMLHIGSNPHFAIQKVTIAFLARLTTIFVLTFISKLKNRSKLGRFFIALGAIGSARQNLSNLSASNGEGSPSSEPNLTVVFEKFAQYIHTFSSKQLLDMPLIKSICIGKSWEVLTLA